MGIANLQILAVVPKVRPHQKGFAGGAIVAGLV